MKKVICLKNAKAHAKNALFFFKTHYTNHKTFTLHKKLLLQNQNVVKKPRV